MDSSSKLLGKSLYIGREKTGDVTFIVDSERIPAHRNVLAALSPKYEAQFYGKQPDQGDIHVKDVSAAAFNEFIKLFYLEEADLSCENLEDILCLSKQCLVDTFVKKCESFLLGRIATSNVCWTYRLAILYDLRLVRVSSASFIGKTPQEVLCCNDFLECDLDTLLHILDVEPLDCQETVVFESCISWARASCERKNLDPMEMEKLRAELGNAVTKLRFKSMSLNAFVTLNEKYKGFFTAEEFIEISNIIGGLLNFTPQKFNNTLRKERPRETRSLDPHNQSVTQHAHDFLL